METKDRVIAALDLDTYEKAEAMVEKLKGEIEVFKVGIAPFTSYGERITRKITSLGKKIFLDLKVHDIPNTARNAARAAAEKEVFMMNFHCIGGEEMMAAAREGADSVKTSGRKPLLLGVTVLTSMDEIALEKIGIRSNVEEKVLEFARMAKASGFDGVVASAKEARKIKESLGEDFIVVTPGIRPEGSSGDDQRRVMTPARAFKEGSDYIVVGRPIVEASDPAFAARNIIEQAGR
jgi:orotidine-5'-phosphate decarboxylase